MIHDTNREAVGGALLSLLFIYIIIISLDELYFSHTQLYRV